MNEEEEIVTPPLTKAEMKAELARLRADEALRAELPPKRPVGHPRVYSAEEAAQRRVESNARTQKQRNEDLTDEQKVARSLRGKEYREAHPEQTEVLRKVSYNKKMDRYRTDPEYHARVNEYQRNYKAKKKADKIALESKMR